MAETIVISVLEKITGAAVKKALQLWGARKIVQQQVEKVGRELNWIRAFLKDADRKQILDETQKQWVKELREVAYWIENVIDTFLCHEAPQKEPGMRGAIKRMFRGESKIVRNLGDEIGGILARLQEVSANKDRFGISSLGEDGAAGKRRPIRPPVLPDIEDLDVIGFDGDRDNIIRQLLDPSTPRRSVVSIVGTGGLGKTTLAKRVYTSDEVQRTFDIQIWVAISQEFKIIDIVRKIKGGIREIDEREQEKDEEYFLTDIFRSLKEKRYLLIIDDVWTTDLWMHIEKALPNDNNGSRILMTTRKFEVAKDADPAHKPYELNFLTAESSLELLLKKALLYQENQNNSNNLLDFAKEFVKKCGGLPLALVILGGLLAKKQPSYSAWSRVMQTMKWHDGKQNVMEIIGTSYDDLPLALKSCFMYFAAFPKGYNIDGKSLLRMWIAEGFIPHEENETLEDTAKSFLEDLVQRSMIQVPWIPFGNEAITKYRIHDLQREVAIQKAKEDNFLTVRSNPEERICDSAHRVAVHNLFCNEWMKYASRNLRALLIFDSKIPDCSCHKFLKVLSGDMSQGAGSHESNGIDMKCLEELSQLRYLQLNGKMIECTEKRSFEKLIGRMKFLQTLDLFSLNGFSFGLPDCIWHIKTLRHVMLQYTDNTLGPPPTVDLPNLQTLIGVRSRESWVHAGLPNLPNLLELGIEITEGFPWGLVAAFLSTLKYLVTLDIRGGDIPTEVVDMRGFPFYQNLNILRYKGRLSLSCHDFDVSMFPAHLTQLVLNNSELQQDHLTVLEKLQGLKELILIEAYSNKKMRCTAGGFPSLEGLIIKSLIELEEWEIEEGAMSRLTHLFVRGGPELQLPHGLQHLTSLTRLEWDFDEYSSPIMHYQYMKAKREHGTRRPSLACNFDEYSGPITLSQSGISHGRKESRTPRRRIRRASGTQDWEKGQKVGPLQNTSSMAFSAVTVAAHQRINFPIQAKEIRSICKHVRHISIRSFQEGSFHYY